MSIASTLELQFKKKNYAEPFPVIPSVRLTCIAGLSPISQSILNRLSLNFVWTICESLGDYHNIFIEKYCIAKKLDHLACNAIQG